MNSVILKIAIRVLKPLFLVVSIWLLTRGHNYPGGGFIGGLIAGSALIFKPLSTFNTESLIQQKDVNPASFLTIGMACILISATIGLITDGAILDASWVVTNWPDSTGNLSLGTPMLFDLGIYLIVIGFIYFIFITMMEEWQWN